MISILFDIIVRIDKCKNNIKYLWEIFINLQLNKKIFFY